MSFVGQAIISWPVAKLFGSSISTYQVFVACLGALGLCALWATVRLWLPVRSAVLVTAVVAGGPVYGTLAVSYMTDVPAFAAPAVCVLAAARVADTFTRR